MVMAFFGNHISKCNRLSKNIRPIQAIEVLYRLRNKQKHYIIYSETPCSTNTFILIQKTNLLTFSNNYNETIITINNVLYFIIKNDISDAMLIKAIGGPKSINLFHYKYLCHVNSCRSYHYLLVQNFRTN